MSDHDDGLRELIDLAQRAIDALVSTTVPPRDLPAWVWDVARELHRVGSHGEAPHPETTRRLDSQVERAYDEQVNDPDWWARESDGHDDDARGDGSRSKMRKAADVAADVLQDPEARDEIDATKASIFREQAVANELADAIKAAILRELGIAGEPLTDEQRRITQAVWEASPGGGEPEETREGYDHPSRELERRFHEDPDAVAAARRATRSKSATRRTELGATRTDPQDVVAHLWWLDETHDLLGPLYEWDHDPLGYRAGRTCQECGVRSPKHALLEDRHTPACRVRAVEEMLGIRKLGDKTFWPDPKAQESADE